MDSIKVNSGFPDGQDLSVQAKRGFSVPWIIRLHQDADTIAITPAAVPALIEALQAAAKGAGNE